MSMFYVLFVGHNRYISINRTCIIQNLKSAGNSKVGGCERIQNQHGGVLANDLVADHPYLT